MDNISKPAMTSGEFTSSSDWRNRIWATVTRVMRSASVKLFGTKSSTWILLEYSKVFWWGTNLFVIGRTTKQPPIDITRQYWPRPHPTYPTWSGVEGGSPTFLTWVGQADGSRPTNLTWGRGPVPLLTWSASHPLCGQNLTHECKHYLPSYFVHDR